VPVKCTRTTGPAWWPALGLASNEGLGRTARFLIDPIGGNAKAKACYVPDDCENGDDD